MILAINSKIEKDVQCFKSKAYLNRFVKDRGFSSIAEYKKLSGYWFGEGKDEKSAYDDAGCKNREVKLRVYNKKNNDFE